MAALNSLIASLAGAVATPIAAAGAGDSIPADDKTVLLVQNPTGGGIDISFDSPAADNFGIVHNAHDVGPVTIPAAGWRLFGPFPSNRFADATRRVQITYSAAGLNVWPISV